MIERFFEAPSGPLRVSQVTGYIKALIEGDDVLSALSVQGEVCELSRSSAGHIYLSLKDSRSQVSCVLFRREASLQPEEVQSLRKGASVVVHGFLTLYEPRGTYQIYIQNVRIQGEGASFRRFEKLKSQLESEGLFSEERKRALPSHPRKVALITSPGSQAFHDVLHRLRTQYPLVTVIVAGVSVQGDGAADEMTMAIDIVNRLTDAEVILLVRGGGSPEDLDAFNGERLARAVFASRIPVVTGVGHETDQTMVDFVADWRAATPSLAAAVAVPDMRNLFDQAVSLRAELSRTMRARIDMDRTRWANANRALLRASPQNRLRLQHQRAEDLTKAADRAIAAQLRLKKQRLQSLESQLRGLNPLAILARGYAVLTDRQTGAVVSHVHGLYSGQELRAQVSDGDFGVKVTEG